MKKIGLALSGGGFRATLYHLGLARFLHDAGILSSVTHISSVSGGSIFAAHLALNWDRYNGSSNDFDAAASELLSFVRLDVRNRILRRFPLLMPVNWLRKLCLMGSHRKLTRVGLLEAHYQCYLFGDTLLSQLPATPQLHILATNLSEGGICSFNRHGVLLQRRQADGSFRFQSIHAGLATVPMAVTASSAFPGFFPPIYLSSADVGARAGEFPNQAFTDGGVFDNLGVRLFRYLERSWLTETPLAQHEFIDYQAAAAALLAATKSNHKTPLFRLAQILATQANQPAPLLLTEGPAAGEPRACSSIAGEENGGDLLLARLGDVMHHHQLYREPMFAGLKLEDPRAQALLQSTQTDGRSLDAGDQVWLNRHLLEAAFRLATHQPCFRHLNSGLDGVIVSDVGKNFSVQSHRSGGGIIQTAVRATDILMDRVWQLEKENFGQTPGFIFAPVTGVVDPANDPTALPPELQRQAANIRTDLDRFSQLEISSLVRHGYCIGRQTCRLHPDVFGANLPANGSWDLLPAPRPIRVSTSLSGRSRAPAPETVEARALQTSASRRTLSTLLDYRDWLSYLYVPIVVPLLFLLPYVAARYYQRSQRISQIVDSLAQGSRDLEQMTRLLEGPVTPWVGESAEELPSGDKPDYTGFLILQDSRIIDLRGWRPRAAGGSEANSAVYGYRRLKVLKQPENTSNQVFRTGLLATSPKTQVRFPPQRFKPTLLARDLENTKRGEKQVRWEATVDFQKVPAGDWVDIIYEHLSPGDFLRNNDSSTTLTFDVEAETTELIRWLLMPYGKDYRNFHLIRYQTGKPGAAENVKLVTEYLADDSSILAFKLLSLKPGYTYELTWYYR